MFYNYIEGCLTHQAGKGNIVREVFMEETLEMSNEDFVGNSN